MAVVLSAFIGYVAAIIGTALMLPQLIKIIKTRKVRDLSWGMLWLYFANCALWLTYGILISAMPVVICNFLALLVSVIQLVLKYRYS